MGQPRYRWVIVAAGGLLGCVAFGALFSLPVFLRPIAQATGWSITGVSTAMTIAFVAMAVGSIAWGSLSDRLGPRVVVLAGSILLAASLALASLTRVAPGVPAHLRRPGRRRNRGNLRSHDGLRDGLVRDPAEPRGVPRFCGHGHGADDDVAVGGLARFALRLADGAADHQRPGGGHHDSGRVPRAQPTGAGGQGAVAIPDQDSGPEMSRGQALRSPQFIILLLTNFFCCATHSGPIFHTVSYAVTCGIPLIIAVSIYSVEGLAGLGGRVAFGLLGDRFGAKHVLVVGLLVQAFGTLGYLAARELATFYTVAALFGFIYAGVMPLYSVIARENFPLRMMGTVIGGMAMAGGLGMATGPVAGGLIYDSFASYSWLFIISFGVGIGAFLIALTFKPFPRKPPVPAAA